MESWHFVNLPFASRQGFFDIVIIAGGHLANFPFASRHALAETGEATVVNANAATRAVDRMDDSSRFMNPTFKEKFISVPFVRPSLGTRSHATIAPAHALSETSAFLRPRGASLSRLRARAAKSARVCAVTSQARVLNGSSTSGPSDGTPGIDVAPIV